MAAATIILDFRGARLMPFHVARMSPHETTRKLLIQKAHERKTNRRTDRCRHFPVRIRAIGIGNY
jgi:hypothetical protein